MSRKKIAAVFGAFVIIILAFLGFFLANKNNNTDAVSEYEAVKEGMTAWDDAAIPGIALFVPDDYEHTDNGYYSVYKKGNASVSLTSEISDNDVTNYAYYAVGMYKNTADSLTVKEEYEEELANTTVHVIEFDYTLDLDNGENRFSCLTAYVMGNGRAYILTCITDPEEFSLYREDFHRIYKSIYITDAENGNEKK